MNKQTGKAQSAGLLKRTIFNNRLDLAPLHPLPGFLLITVSWESHWLLQMAA